MREKLPPNNDLRATRKKLPLLFPLLLLPVFWSCTAVDQQGLAIYAGNQTLTEELLLTSSPADDQLAALAPPEIIEEEPSEGLTPPEPEQTVAQEVEELEALGKWEEGQPQPDLKEEISYDFPITLNRQVEYYLDRFQNRQHASFQLWLQRSGKYLPMITAQLAEAGLPLDLAYLPMIESGFSLTAYSSARAVGPWQFMRATAVSYGLKINDYIDERRDPIRSTEAAIHYLSELYSQFGSWHLAVAAYNAGEGKIHRAISRYQTRNFWEIAQQHYLHPETKRYVPKLIAAILIAKEPEKYGFTDLEYEAPLAYETAEVPRWTSLQAVAIAAATDYETLKNLNRQLRQDITPPDLASYELRVPPGTAELVAKTLPRVHVAITTQYKSHVIRPGETVDQVCRLYDLNKKTLLKANNLRKAKLTPGNHLRIPYQVTNYSLLSEEEYAKRGTYTAAATDFILHKVQPGETVSEIATRYHVAPQLIASWNGLRSINKIKAGQQLALHIAPQATMADSRAATAGQADRLMTTANTTYYKVQGGDSLWAIARKFKLNTAEIKQWNNLTDNTIHPGLELVLKKEI